MDGESVKAWASLLEVWYVCKRFSESSKSGVSVRGKMYQ